MSLKLNIGCGPHYAPGWTNLDVHQGDGVTPDVVVGTDGLLPFADSSAERIYAGHVIEHVPWSQLAAVIHEWRRVLKPGGVLLNFDADYAANVRSRSTQNRRVPADSPYGHVGMTDRLQRENDEITLTMDVGRARPAWDREVLEGIGFADCRVDTRVGRRILGLLDLEHAPMFGIAARKP